MDKEKRTGRSGQTVTVVRAVGGSFTLTSRGITSGPIPFDATEADVQGVLDTLVTIADNNEKRGAR